MVRLCRPRLWRTVDRHSINWVILSVAHSVGTPRLYKGAVVVALGGGRAGYLVLLGILMLVISGAVLLGGAAACHCGGLLVLRAYGSVLIYRQK
jgi:hypothetical protein